VWIDRLLANPTNDALALSIQFAEARQRVLAENVANINTPDYQTKKVDAAKFRAALGEALQAAEPAKPLKLQGGAQFSTDDSGTLSVQPEIDESSNALFHDGTNARLETLLSDVAENQLQHEFSVNLLRERYNLLLIAIRGRAR
jgi:flagellar basal-body rod protein FlgB